MGWRREGYDTTDHLRNPHIFIQDLCYSPKEQTAEQEEEHKSKRRKLRHVKRTPKKSARMAKSIWTYILQVALICCCNTDTVWAFIFVWTHYACYNIPTQVSHLIAENSAYNICLLFIIYKCV